MVSDYNPILLLSMTSILIILTLAAWFGLAVQASTLPETTNVANELGQILVTDIANDLGAQVLQNDLASASTVTLDQHPASRLASLMSNAISTITPFVDDLLFLRNAIADAYDNPSTPSAISDDACCDLPRSSLTYSAFYNGNYLRGQSCTRTPTGIHPPPLDKGVVAASSTLLDLSSVSRAAYYGTVDGTTTLFPAFDIESCSGYDPRLRPWYVRGASPGGKDVVIVIDKSGSMGGSRIWTARRAAQAVLDGLSPVDRVAVIAFSDSIRTRKPSGCFDSEMAYATPENLETLSSFVSSIQAEGGTHYALALDAAFDYFDSIGWADPVGGSTRSRVILFLTDGVPTDSTAAIRSAYSSRNVGSRVAIFPYAFGFTSSSSVPAILNEMAASNGGAPVTVVPDSGDLRRIMGTYYSLLPSSDPSDPPVWSTPYFDANGLGVVVTVSLPIYHDVDFKGVIGIDMTLTDIFGEAVFAPTTGLAYPFVIDKMGNAIVHPGLVLPDDISDPPTYFSISLLETDDPFQPGGSIYDPMVGGLSDCVSYTKTFHVARGSALRDGTFEEDKAVTVCFAPMPNTPFRVGFLTALDDADPTILRKSGVSDPIPRSSYLHITNEAECTHLNLPAIITAPTFHLAPSAFSFPAFVTSGNISLTDVEALQNGLASGSLIDLPRRVALRDPESILTAALLASSIGHLWSQPLEVSASVTRYVTSVYACFTPSGFFYLYPGMPSHPTYDCTIRPWFIRAQATAMTGSGSSLTISPPYFDALGGGLVVTIAQAVEAHGRVRAVLGADISLYRLASLMEEAGCSVSTSSSVCFLMDSSGYIVYHPSYPSMARSAGTSFEPLFISDLYGVFASRLSDLGAINGHYCADFSERIRRAFYTIELGTQTIVHPGGKAHVARVGGTNLMVVHLEYWQSFQGPTSISLAVTPLEFYTCPAIFPPASAVIAPCPANRDAASAPLTSQELIEASAHLDVCMGDHCSSLSYTDCAADIRCRTNCASSLSGFCTPANAPPVNHCPSPSRTPSPSPSLTPSITRTPSVTPSVTPTISVTPSVTPTPSPPTSIRVTLTFTSVSKVSFDAADTTAFQTALTNDLIGLIPGLDPSNVQITSMVILRGQSSLTVTVTLATYALNAQVLAAEAPLSTWSLSLGEVEAFRCNGCDTPTVCSPECEDESSSVPIGAVIGGIVGAILIVGLIGLSVYLYKKKEMERHLQARAVHTSSAIASPHPYPPQGPPGPQSPFYGQGGYPRGGNLSVL
jgi:uncharacterized protein YegL